jgi:outer membrane protein OmpU
MKKILFVAMLGALSNISYAQSSVTLFGTVGGGVRWQNGVKGGDLVGFNNNIIAGNDFGIMGKEDLGGGLKAIFVFDSSFNSGTGALKASEPLFSKASYVGLTGDFGRLTFGRQFNAAQNVGVILDPINARSSSIAVAPEAVYGGNFFTLDTRFNNTIKYIAQVGGLRLGGSYSPGEVAGNSRAGSNFAAGATYQLQSLLGGVGYQKTYNAAASQWTETFEAGGTLQLDKVRLYLSYAVLNVSSSTSGAPMRRDKVPTIGIIYQVTPSLQLTAAIYDDIASNLGNINAANGKKLTSYAIAEYFLSKKTELYAELDHNGFTGAYKRDPTNIAAFNLRPGGSATTGVSIGVMTHF